MGKNILKALFFLSVLGCSVGGYFFYALQNPGPLLHGKTLLIPQGAGVAEIGLLLVDEGILNNPWVFTAAVLLHPCPPLLKAGEYFFPAFISPYTVIKILNKGEVVRHFVTIPEGWRMDEIIQKLNALPILKGTILKVPSEGAALPQTYDFYYGEQRQSLLNRMTAAMEKSLAEIWENREAALPVASPRDLLIMASMVEKETGIAAERPRIAGVFLNRLRIGMRLQACPTVLYGLMMAHKKQGESLKTWELKLTLDDLQLDSPYNTYRIKGLPPAPIACPGYDSLYAVAHPLATKELYFAANGIGGHQFAEGFFHHKKNHFHLRQVHKQKLREQKQGMGR